MNAFVSVHMANIKSFIFKPTAFKIRVTGIPKQIDCINNLSLLLH